MYRKYRGKYRTPTLSNKPNLIEISKLTITKKVGVRIRLSKFNWEQLLAD